MKNFALQNEKNGYYAYPMSPNVPPRDRYLVKSIVHSSQLLTAFRFSIGARRFLNDWNGHGPAHHCAVGVGHISSKLKKLGALLGMECVQVC